MPIGQVISGGQTGVDRAALDAARDLGMRVGGYCTRSRLAEDGHIDDAYGLITLLTDYFPDRTRANVVGSTFTLILVPDRKFLTSSGTMLTIKLCEQLKKKGQWCVAGMNQDNALDQVHSKLKGFEMSLVLNVAGPRESKAPGVYDKAYYFLNKLFRRLK